MHLRNYLLLIWYFKLLFLGGKRRTRKELSIDEKLEIISLFESGKRPGHIAQGRRMRESSVREIIKRKEELKKCKSFTLWSIQN